MTYGAVARTLDARASHAASTDAVVNTAERLWRVLESMAEPVCSGTGPAPESAWRRLESVASRDDGPAGVTLRPRRMVYDLETEERS